MATPVATRFSPQPLVRQIELAIRPEFNHTAHMEIGATHERIGEVLGVDRRTVERWINRGVMLDRWTADRYAVKVGIDACLLWDDWYA